MSFGSEFAGVDSEFGLLELGGTGDAGFTAAVNMVAGAASFAASAVLPVRAAMPLTAGAASFAGSGELISTASVYLAAAPASLTTTGHVEAEGALALRAGSASLAIGAELPAAGAMALSAGGALMTINARAGFPHVGPLAVTSVSPDAGGQRQSVTITGAGFYGTTRVAFGAYASFDPPVVVSDTVITVTAPDSPWFGSADDHDPVTVDVQVFTLDVPAGSPIGPADRYTFTAPPVLYSVSPSRGSTAANTPVTIYGKNLAGISQIELGPFGATAGGITIAPDGRSLAALLLTSDFTGNLIGTYPCRAFNGSDFSRYENPLFTIYPAGTSSPPPPTVIDDALSGRYGPIATRYVFEQRDRANGFLADLTPAVLADAAGCVIHLDNTQAVTRTVDLVFGKPELLPDSFDPADAPTFNVAVFAIVPTPTGDVRLQRGLFGLDRPTVIELPAGKSRWEVKGADNGLVLAGAGSAVPYVVRAGSSYVNTVGAICAGFGLPEAVSALSGDGLNYSVPVDLSWADGTSFLEIVNDLLRGINCFPVYADSDGTMRSRQRLDPAAEAPAVAYRTDREPRMLVAPSSRQQVTAGIYNQISCAVDDPNRVPYTGVRTNIDPDSPVSTVRIPLNFKALTGGAQDGSKAIQSNAMADTVADYEVRSEACRARPRTIQTQPDPRRTAHEFYRLTIEAFETDTLWRVVKWEETCFPGGPHTHTLEFAQAIAVSQ